MLNEISALLTRIRQENPLILNITNDVTSDFIANGLLCLGAAPVMSKAYQEADELVQLAAAVVINPGTLNDDFIKLSQHVCVAANRYHKPIILDPVGVGASQYRTAYSQDLLKQFNIAIVRGNASEIMALAGTAITTKGVDSAAETAFALESAKALAARHTITVVISGKTDIIVDNTRQEQFERGSSLMPKITGTGCLLSAVVGAFRAIHSDCFEAAHAATLFYSLCGEQAEQLASAPASFKLHFLDAIARGEIIC